MAESEVQYISDDEGTVTAVIIPVRLWHEIASERETAYLLKSPAMRTHLLDALQRADSIPLDEARARVGL
jgi:hypothetical protein